MTSFSARGASLMIVLASLSRVAWAQEAGVPSLFPFPPVGTNYPVTQTTATDALWYQGEQSPARPMAPNPGAPAAAAPGDTGQSVISPDYQDAMKGDWDGSCTACTTGCCPHNYYVYANALVMTKDKRGGFVTSIDSTTFEPQVFFCSPEFGRLWHGGFEIGGGWCFGCDCSKALEVVYWGLYPAEGSARASGSLDSMIDFSDLDYNGGSANDPFTASTHQRVTYQFDLHSLEVNLVGNGCCGGPFGCGMCGCCDGRGGSPWGFGWVAGFRYINFSEDFLFSGDTTDFDINGDVTELNYAVDTENNLWGMQIGGGISYCVTNSFTAYSIAKLGIYTNHIEQSQRIYGPAGNATLNNGQFNGEDFVIDASDDDLALAGQLDLGGRWAFNDCWSINFGYRVLGLTGVAISEDNVAQGNFQNVLGIADTQTTGSALIHGGFAGVTYCW